MKHDYTDEEIRTSWKDSLSLREFLAALPERPQAQPILSDDGRSLGQVAYEAYLDAGGVGLVEKWQAAAQAVVAAARPAIEAECLARAVRRMQGVTWEQLWKIYCGAGSAQKSMTDIRACLIAAAKGEGQAKEVPPVVHVNNTGCEPMAEETSQALGAMVKAAKEAGINGLKEAQPWTPAVGDVVRLKSGGPVMTVVEIRQGDDVQKSHVVWITEEGRVSGIESLSAACLTPAKP